MLLQGCLCTVHVLSLLLCGVSDPPSLFITNAADHITPRGMPLTKRGTGREKKTEELVERLGERCVDWRWL